MITRDILTLNRAAKYIYPFWQGDNSRHPWSKKLDEFKNNFNACFLFLFLEAFETY